MRLPAWMDGLHSVWGMSLSPSPLTGGETGLSRMSSGHSRRRTGAHEFVRPGGNKRGEGEKRNHPASITASLPPRFSSRTTLKHAVTRLVAGGLLFLVASATHATAPVGATPGELEVTTRGSAKYTIPIVG